MSIGKDPEIAKLEQSLIQFLCAKPDTEERVTGGHRRIRGLTIVFDIRNDQKPLICVQIGMSEVSFNISNANKERGHCYGIDKHIQDWIVKPNINYEIVYIVKKLLKNR